MCTRDPVFHFREHREVSKVGITTGKMCEYHFVHEYAEGAEAHKERAVFSICDTRNAFCEVLNMEVVLIPKIVRVPPDGLLQVEGEAPMVVGF